jgi:nucleoside-diphosphate-sugar epimerase
VAILITGAMEHVGHAVARRARAAGERLRGPLAGDRLRRDTGHEVGHSLEDGIRACAGWLRAHPELYA